MSKGTATFVRVLSHEEGGGVLYRLSQPMATSKGTASHAVVSATRPPAGPVTVRIYAADERGVIVDRDDIGGIHTGSRPAALMLEDYGYLVVDDSRKDTP